MHADAVGLQDEDSVVPVGHEAREVVALSMNHPEDVGVFKIKESETLAVVDGRAETGAEEIFVNLRGVEREDFADDALILIMSCGHPLSAGIDDIDEVSLLQFAVDTFYRSRKNPRVTAEDGFLLARGYD